MLGELLIFLTWQILLRTVEMSKKKKKNTVEPLGTDTSLIRTPLYHGQFPMYRQNSHIFSLKKNLYNADSL